MIGGVAGGLLTAGIVTADQLAGITDAVTGNVDVLLPVGITVMSILLGVKIIPKVIHTFF